MNTLINQITVLYSLAFFCLFYQVALIQKHHDNDTQRNLILASAAFFTSVSYLDPFPAGCFILYWHLLLTIGTSLMVKEQQYCGVSAFSIDAHIQAAEERLANSKQEWLLTPKGDFNTPSQPGVINPQVPNPYPPQRANATLQHYQRVLKNSGAVIVNSSNGNKL